MGHFLKLPSPDTLFCPENFKIEVFAMRLLVLVLNKVDKLEDILSEFLNSEISGATILSSTGMARVLSGREDNEEYPLVRVDRSFLNPAQRGKAKHIFAANA
jgi:hypothetical protein